MLKEFKNILKYKNNHCCDKNGFSLVEAVVASLIFATAVVGVFATMSSFKKPSIDSDKKLMAAFIGKQVLEDLRVHVDQRDWDTGASPLSPLGGGRHPSQLGQFFNAFNPTYSVNYQYFYTVTQDVSGSRQVNLTLSWP